MGIHDQTPDIRSNLIFYPLATMSQVRIEKFSLIRLSNQIVAVDTLTENL